MNLNIPYFGHTVTLPYVFTRGAHFVGITLMIHGVFTNQSQVENFSAQQHIAWLCIEGKHERHYREVGGGVCLQ